MAQFEPGDKVKFLNSVGGGIVKKIQGGMVYVEDETGFDMPFAPSEHMVRDSTLGDQRASGPPSSCWLRSGCSADVY